MVYTIVLTLCLFSFCHAQISFGNNGPSRNQQTLNQIQPTFGQNQPTFGQNRPTIGQNRPNLGQNQFSSNRPSFSRPSVSSSQNTFSSNGFTVRNTDQRRETGRHSGCCLFSSSICSGPCGGNSCSSQCTVQCVLGGTCPPISCSTAAPTTCISTTQPTTTTSQPTTAITTTTPTPSTPCPFGYTQASSSKCWKVSFGSANWLDALTTCIQQGGTLASVENQQEQDTLQGLIGSSNMWIGLSDIVSEGTFTWRDNSPLSYTAWRSGHPNNGGGNQHCVNSRAQVPLGWDDVACGKVQPYICQKNALFSGAPRI